MIPDWTGELAHLEDRLALDILLVVSSASRSKEVGGLTGLQGDSLLGPAGAADNIWVRLVRGQVW